MVLKKNPHILVVDDDDVLLRGMCDLLEVEGYRVSGAFDGVNALQTLEEMAEYPDLIISDIRMPNMDGYEFLASVRERVEWLSIPFIFLTAKGQKEDIRYGKLRGVDDYIIKPFDFQDLFVSVRSALRRREELTAYEERRMEALKQRILTVLHHEFRTPLSYIVAYADLMASTPSFKHSEELHQYIQGILRGSERLTSLIDSFLILAELESGYGRQVYERRNAVIEDMEDVLSEIMSQQKLKADEQDVELQLTVSPALPPTSGDLTYLRSAFKHLVDNAIKFSPRGVHAVVKVAAVEEDGFIVVSVTDEGPGIAEEEQDRLFDTFYQVNREKNEQQGAGAGLAIARHVAELHGGSIEVESQPGHGSSFMMRLPGVDLLETS